MRWARCPYCGQSDGNDDIILNRSIIYNDYSKCEIVVEKQCDICHEKYKVRMLYNFSHEEIMNG